MAIIQEKMNPRPVPATPQDPRGTGSGRRDGTAALTNQTSNLALSDSSSKDDGFFGSFFSKKPVKKPGVLEPVSRVLYYIIIAE